MKAQLLLFYLGSFLRSILWRLIRFRNRRNRRNVVVFHYVTLWVLDLRGWESRCSEGLRKSGLQGSRGCSDGIIAVG